MSSLPSYAELHCISSFTFLRGASHAEELIARAVELNYSALAITDECSLAGVVRAHVAAKEHKFPLVIGAEFQVDEGPKLVLLATDRTGYSHLSTLITTARRRSKKGSYCIQRSDFDSGIPGCLALLIPNEKSVDSYASWFSDRFNGRGWIAVELHYGPDDRARLNGLRELGEATGLPLVAAGDVHMHVRSRRPLQNILTATRLRKPVAQCGMALYPNAERRLRHRMELARIYPPALLAGTVEIAERCSFSLEELRYEYPAELVPAGQTPASHLRNLTLAGLVKRFPAGAPLPVRDLIEHELTLIAELRYEPFFLTVHDIVTFAKSRGILCQGRGSAANSAVCYALGITEVDPARMSMLFERFMSRERNEPPDIDVDFEHERREEVIQYLYGKYGRERAAIAATVICYRPKSALRDVGRALGLEIEQVNRLSGAIAWWDDCKDLDTRFRAAGFDPASPVMRQLDALATTLQGFPRHLSQHVGGFVISKGPLHELVPIENAAMPDRSIIQWDKDDLDALGLLKVDVLALGMLTAIRKALDFIAGQLGRPFGMADVPSEDPETYAMLQRGESTGVFQVESRAQMSMLPRLKPARFYDLVIEIAIVRPGPIQGGMVHPYLRRRQGKEPVTYPSDAIRGVLERTLGVPIFQEQVMQLAIVAAGFTPGEADQLRRSMAAWKRKGGLTHFKERLVDGMLQRKYKREFAESIFQQILGFGEYGFPESHSASFALLVYVSAWIKRHHPGPFLAALLNSQPMGFYAPAQLVQDARRNGVEVHPVDVQVSEWDCALETAGCTAPAVRLGLRLVKGLSRDAADKLVKARRQTTFLSVVDLAYRTAINQKDLKALAASGALAGLSEHRRRAYWDVAGIDRHVGLLSSAPIDESAPILSTPSEGQNLVADYASLGLTLGRHPLALLRSRLARLRFVPAEKLSEIQPGRTARACGIVTCRQRPGTASGVVFVTLEDETGNVNVIVWNDVVQRDRQSLLGAQLLGVEGVIQREAGVVHLVARRLSDHSELLGCLDTVSRNFH